MRRENRAKNLGAYFQPSGEASYSAVCIHKTLLAQLIATSCRIETDLASFYFNGQIKNGSSDGVGGIHAVLIFTDNDGTRYAADQHKGIYEPFDDYLRKFDNPNGQEDAAKVFTTNTVKVL